MTTNISIDDVIDQLEPWDLRLTIDRQEFQTRPLTLGDLAVLDRRRAWAGQVDDAPARAGRAWRALFHIDPNVDRVDARPREGRSR
jgi:hypothetical protein